MFLQIVVAFLILIGVTFAVVGGDRESPMAQRQAQQEVDNMRGFSFSVERFVASNTAFEGTLTWTGTGGSRALNAVDTTPSSLRAMHMPPAWRAVAKGGDYVLCLPMSEPAVALLGREMPDNIRAHPLAASSQPGGFVVLADARDHQAAEGGTSETRQWAATCADTP